MFRKAQAERIIKQPRAMARQTQNQRWKSPRGKNSPPKTMAAAMRRMGVSGRNSVPTPTIKPAPKAEYCTLFAKGRCVLFKRKSGFDTLLIATTRAQQATAVQNAAETSVSGTAA